MSGRVLGWIAVALALSWGVAWATKGGDEPRKACSLVFSTGYRVDGVPVVVTKAQQAKGLSDRASPGVGMLFDFGTPAPLAFWMKDTRFPLSIGFFDGMGRLIRDSEHMKAESIDYHLSLDPARYALELPAGEFAAHHIKQGTQMQVENCRKL